MTDADLIRLIARVGYNPLGDDDGSTHKRLLRVADNLSTPEALQRELTQHSQDLGFYKP